MEYIKRIVDKEIERKNAKLLQFSCGFDILQELSHKTEIYRKR